MLASEQTRTATQRSRVAVLVFMYDRLPACRWYGQEIQAVDREVPSVPILVQKLQAGSLQYILDRDDRR